MTKKITKFDLVSGRDFPVELIYNLIGDKPAISAFSFNVTANSFAEFTITGHLTRDAAEDFLKEIEKRYVLVDKEKL